jgi:Pyruvate/2-oxoacid:ferredoxin oxidoreductase gamma subunit
LDLVGVVKLATVDATGIAVRHGIGTSLAPIVNTVILGAFARLDPDLDKKSILDAVSEGVPSKVQQNLDAAQEAFDSLNLE